MGRYTSVKGFSNERTKLVGGYVAATGGAEGVGAPKAPRPDKVENVMGSTAGAGSCEFHLYRAARSREVSRLESLESADALEQERAAFAERVDKNRQEAEERTKRNAEKRKKRKRKKLKANGSPNQAKESDDEEEDEEQFKATRTEETY
jgi:Protein of unknown function (DUF1168)